MSANSNTIIEEDLRAIAARDLPWDQLSGCRIVVTGGGGFLGGYLVRTLLSLHRLGRVEVPVQVVALVRNIKRAHERFVDLANDSNLNFVEWDLNTIAVPGLGDVHYVLHAASQASPRFYGVDPVGTMLPNTVGTAALLAALQRSANPKGLLFVSSSEVYGAVNDSAGIKEADYGIVNPMQVRSCYAESKRAGETTCVSFHHQYGIPTWIVRPFHTYGPGLTAEDGRVFSDFTYNVLRNENIVMNSDGSARRAFCYASDAIAGFFTVLLRGEAGIAYNVANANAEMSVMEFAELMVGLFPEKGLCVSRRLDTSSADYVPSAYNHVVPNTARLESLNWQATVTPAQGFKRMIESLQ